MLTTTKPKHEHDCPECIYLGRYKHRRVVTDLYAHEHPADPSYGGKACVEYLMRLSSEGSDYWCTTDYGDPDSSAHIERMPMMAEARRRHTEPTDVQTCV